eukprot:TRINITY_DN67501_c6_g1_i1.p1 TRINITY_DN67501_c6_g1~~TRINITY_DN67501_c6_g1_i1.p1  ORF type:complete len:232 (-),score=9.94 TRINITY_DN67501_c6_g1_i1:1557-2252(-)
MIARVQEAKSECGTTEATARELYYLVVDHKVNKPCADLVRDFTTDLHSASFGLRRLRHPDFRDNRRYHVITFGKKGDFQLAIERLNGHPNLLEVMYPGQTSATIPLIGGKRFGTLEPPPGTHLPSMDANCNTQFCQPTPQLYDTTAHYQPIRDSRTHFNMTVRDTSNDGTPCHESVCSDLQSDWKLNTPPAVKGTSIFPLTTEDENTLMRYINREVSLGGYCVYLSVERCK